MQIHSLTVGGAFRKAEVTAAALGMCLKTHILLAGQCNGKKIRIPLLMM